ncbi:MAG: response regulator transcription factor [Caldilineaceae bacterium]
MSNHILIVDDDPLLRRSLAVCLDQAGYQSMVAGSAEEALMLVTVQPPDLILLDIGLPGMDGLQALQAFRSQLGNVPVIYLTARRRELDEVVALEMGADDYITKPFDLDVLQAHIRAVLRRSSLTAHPSEESIVCAGDLQIDPAGRVATLKGRQLELSPKEFDLLHVLAQNAGRVLSLDELLTLVWGSTWLGETQTLYVHMRWLREKIEEEPAHPRRLVTVRGVGYKFVPAENIGESTEKDTGEDAGKATERDAT